jgi:hypothetical protein
VIRRERYIKAMSAAGTFLSSQLHARAATGPKEKAPPDTDGAFQPEKLGRGSFGSPDLALMYAACRRRESNQIAQSGGRRGLPAN